MGWFSRKIFGEEAVLASLLISFGQSINAVEKSNGIVVQPAWDLFVNKAGWLVDNGFITESVLFELILEQCSFDRERETAINLLKLRLRAAEVVPFEQRLKPLMEREFPVSLSFNLSGIRPYDFIDFIVKKSKDFYPDFGSTLDDQKFYAILGIYFATVFADTDESKSSVRTFQRLTSFTLGLQWFAEWNIAKQFSID